MINSSMETTIDVARQTRKLYMQANLFLRSLTFILPSIEIVKYSNKNYMVYIKRLN